MKWIFSIIGFLLTRKFWGAILGYVVGVFFEKMKSSDSPNYQPFKKYQQNTPTETFEVSLLSLCAIIIKADGKTTQQELDYVRHKFVAMYGQEKANSIFRTFNDIVKHREVSAQRISSFIRMRSGYETRLQILHFLFEIAASDGKISHSEHEQIQRISGYFHLSWQDFESIKAMFVKSEDDAYKILEISKDASDNDVKKAYREMAKKYHPDRVVTDDEAIKKGAEEKFKKVQQAYEKIQKERGI